MRIAMSAALLLMVVGTGSVFAQTPAPAPAPAAQSAAPAAAPATGAATDKKAIAKECIDQANAKGLHGKARKQFKSACKKNGGKAPS